MMKYLVDPAVSNGPEPVLGTRSDSGQQLHIQFTLSVSPCCNNVHYNVFYKKNAFIAQTSRLEGTDNVGIVEEFFVTELAKHLQVLKIEVNKGNK